MAATILVTGFGPFPGAPFNPTGALVEKLARLRRPILADVTIVPHIFRTSYAVVDDELPKLIAKHRPDAILMFGLAPRAKAVRIETRARNALASFPDVLGHSLNRASIVNGGPSALPIRGHTRHLFAAARNARIPILLSRDAGRYLCNYLCWRATEATAQNGLRFAAFVHVPLPSRTVRKSGKRELLTLNDLSRVAGQFLVVLATATQRAPRLGRKGSQIGGKPLIDTPQFNVGWVIRQSRRRLPVLHQHRNQIGVRLGASICGNAKAVISAGRPAVINAKIPGTGPGVMSTQEQISQRNWWVTYVRRVIGHAVRKSRAFVQFNLYILFRPSWVGANVIVDDGPAGLLRAGKYYLKAFGIAFAIALFVSRFQLAEGKSQWRDLVATIAQFVVFIPIIYTLYFILRERIPFYRLVQAALYADGVYLIIAALAAIPVYYFDFTFGIAAGNREQLDVFATEYEHCLAKNSYLYSLLRGHIQYYLYSDVWKPQWATWFLDYYPYLLAIPFLLIFVRMLRLARKISVVLICVVTAMAFIAVEEGRKFAVSQISFLLAVRDTECTFGFIDQVTKNYAPELIARQLAYKIHNQSRVSQTVSRFPSMVVHGKDLILAVKLRPGNSRQMATAVSSNMRQSYCSDNDPYWVAVRRINYNLLLVMHDSDDSLLPQVQFTPKDCPKWPGSR